MLFRVAMFLLGAAPAVPSLEEPSPGQIGDLAAFISYYTHELRTPLTAIRGYAQLLLRQTKHDVFAPLRSSLQVIIDETDKLTAMTDVLLDIGRVYTSLVPLKGDLVDLGLAVRQALAAREEAFGQPPEVRLPEHGPVLRSDTQRLVQIAGAMLDFATARAGTELPIAVQLDGDGDMAQLSVEDAGPALDDQVRRQLLQRLMETPPSVRDRVPGQYQLVIARGIVEAHGGRMTVESPAGGGAGVRLRVWLPLARP